MMSHRAISKSTDQRKKRTITGCLTCRIRRIKCDENKPGCANCDKAKRNCEGYPDRRVVRKKKAHDATDGDIERPPSPTHSHASSPSDDSDADSSHHVQPDQQEDKLSFATFLDSLEATKRLKSLAVPEFWELALQMTSSEPAIRNLALAIGALNRRAEAADTTDETDVQSLELAMLSHYGDALHDTQDLIKNMKQESDVCTVLVACALFVWVETLRGNFDAAQEHMSKGMEIVSGNLHSVSDENIVPESAFISNLELISESLARADIQLKTFAGSHTAYPYSPLMPSMDDLPIPDRPFSTVCSALEHMVRLWKTIMHFTNIAFCHVTNPFATKAVIQDVWTLKERCQDALDKWHKAFEHLDNTMKRPPPGKKIRIFQYHVCRLLRVYNQISRLMLKSSTCADESEWDHSLSEFQLIIAMVEGLQMDRIVHPEEYCRATSFGLGVNLVLFIIACKCREPNLRRRAIQLMEETDTCETKTCEGAMDGPNTARVAQKVVDYEEKLAQSYVGTQIISTAADIPRSARVCAVELQFHRWQRVELNFVTLKREHEGTCIIPICDVHV